MEIYIDGYNLLHLLEKKRQCWPLQENPNREMWLVYLDGLLTKAGIKATIVLEGKLNHSHLTYSLTTLLGYLTVVDPPAHICADRFLIEKAAAHHSPHLVCIITNDLALTKALRQLGVATQKVELFLSMLSKKAAPQKEGEEKKLPYLQEEKDRELFEKRYDFLQNRKKK